MIEDALALLDGPGSWVLYFLCAMFIGMSKTGILNIGTLAIPIFAMLFGARYSTGIVLIMLCFADLVAVIYYRKEFIWHEVKKLLPMAITGLVVALVVGNYVDDKAFRVLISACILVGVGIMLWTNDKPTEMVNRSWYSPVFGFLMGFSTMIGNAAGPALSVYMLSKRLDKVAFTATAAWFIMILNFTKIPLQLFYWENLSLKGFILNVMALPFILLGGYLGIRLLKIIPEKQFRQVVVAMVIISTLFLLIS